MGAQPLEEMRARRSRRALSTWRRYSASTTGAAIADEEETLEIGGDRREERRVRASLAFMSWERSQGLRAAAAGGEEATR